MTTETSAVRLASGPRTVLARPGVGAAGHVVQRSELTTHRVAVEHASLIFVGDGTKRIRWSGGVCVARAEQALSVQAGEVVDISNTPGRSGTYRALWICWFPELLAATNVEVGPRRHPSPGAALHADLGGDFLASFHRAFDSLSAGDALPARIATSRLQEVLLWLAERGFRFAPPRPATLGQRLRGLVSSDPAADWSMDHVARGLGTSVPTLRRKLTSEGIAFRDLVQDVRMVHALTLLENTEAPVLHVALAAGYASPSRFSARFRARFGYLPTDIRGQNRGSTLRRLERSSP